MLLIVKLEAGDERSNHHIFLHQFCLVSFGERSEVFVVLEQENCLFYQSVQNISCVHLASGQEQLPLLGGLTEGEELSGI